MDPTAPAQLIAWAVAGLIALFSLGGCNNGGSYGSGYTDSPIFIPRVQQQQYFPPARTAPVSNCLVSGNMLFCS